MIALIAALLIAAAGHSQPDIVREHSETLNRIRATYHLKIRREMRADEKSETLLHDVDWEVWHSGLRHRIVSRSYFLGTTDGFTRVPEPNGRVVDLSFDEKETRNLAGWDPERPPQLPLEFGRNAKEFAEVRCGIGVRDPAFQVGNEECISLLWELAPGLTLARLAEAAQLVEIPSGTPSYTRLRIESTRDKTLATLVGTMIDLDREHGSLIRRVHWANGILKFDDYVSEVTQIAPAGSDLWIPIEVQATYSGGTPLMKSRVIEFQVGEGIPDRFLQTQFPEGARVNDSSGEIHVWGNGKPERSFTNFESFMQHLYSRAREMQSKDNSGEPLAPKKDASRVGLVWVINGVLIAVLAILTLVRRRLLRTTKTN